MSSNGPESPLGDIGLGFERLLCSASRGSGAPRAVSDHPARQGYEITTICESVSPGTQM
jgi:hypothetical protein